MPDAEDVLELIGRMEVSERLGLADTMAHAVWRAASGRSGEIAGPGMRRLAEALVRQWVGPIRSEAHVRAFLRRGVLKLGD